MLNKVDIFGEIHTKEDRDRIEALIRENHKAHNYQFLLTEEIGSESAFTTRDKQIGIRNNLWSISPRSYELGIKLDIPVIGIDTWDESVYVKDIKDKQGFAIDFTRSFLLRETRMVEVIKKYSLMGNCAVIVGDSHLRTVKTKELGNISLLQKEFSHHPGFEIFRSPNGEIK